MGVARATWLVWPLVLAATTVSAQEQAPSPESSPESLAAAPSTNELVDPAKLKRPALAFAETPEIAAEFDKYFYFHRADTSFEEAYGDVRECDAMASGSRYYAGQGQAAKNATMAQYGALAGGVGGAIGSAIGDAIAGSAERRKQRRINLRNCMGFKGYQRFGLSGDLWKEFNFEEGLGRKREDVRDEALELQALVASGPAPTTKVLGL